MSVLHNNKKKTIEIQESYDDFVTWNVISSKTTIDEDSEECPEIISPIQPMYEWDTATTCVGYDKYILSSQTVSYDNGETWTNTGIEYTEFFESNSSDCDYQKDTEPQYRWVTSNTCVGYDKHEISGQQICFKDCTEDKNWFNTGLLTFSLDSEGNPIVTANSEDCGYKDVNSKQYRWVTDEGFICDEENHIKYNKRTLQVFENGEWKNTDPLVTENQLVEVNSEDCGFIRPKYRWVDDGNPYCKNDCYVYQKIKQQISEDNGETWADTGIQQEVYSDVEINCCEQFENCCEKPSGCNLIITSGNERMESTGGTVVFNYEPIF